MQNRHALSTKTIAFMVIGGAVVGAAAGVLLAPKSGRDTRKELKSYANKLGGSVAGVAHRTKAGIEAAVEKGRSLLESKAA
jgi:gas vesicle protein